MSGSCCGITPFMHEIKPMKYNNGKCILTLVLTTDRLSNMSTSYIVAHICTLADIFHTKRYLLFIIFRQRTLQNCFLRDGNMVVNDISKFWRFNAVLSCLNITTLANYTTRWGTCFSNEKKNHELLNKIKQY